jgi:tetratricopeptide (TPR) repeat protein
MPRDDARWILGLLETLTVPEAGLVRELLQHMAELRAAPDAEEPFDFATRTGAPRPLPAELETETQKNRELQQQQAALHTRLREGWRRVRDLPPCRMQCQLLKEVAYFGGSAYLVTDPLADDAAPLTPDRAMEYARRAVELARQLGDQTGMAEACTILGGYYLGKADYARAMDCWQQAIEVAERIGNLHVKHLAYRRIAQYLDLTAGLGERVQWQRQIAQIARQKGDVNTILKETIHLAQLMVLNGEIEEGVAVIEELHQLLEKAGGLREIEILGFYHHYYSIRAFLCQQQGRFEEAITHLQNSVQRNTESPACHEDFLWYDLAFLESLCQRTGGDFAGFCRQLRLARALNLEQWHLLPARSAALAWAETHPLAIPLPSPWKWVDPLGKCACKWEEEGLEITPAMGVGFGGKVNAPRVSCQIGGNFTVETVLDFAGNPTRAGGLMACQDDRHLIRLGAGIQYDGEITLSAKAPDRALAIVGRGLLITEKLRLRLERRGNRFTGWCGAGGEWYRCGQVELEMEGRLEVGMFAECTYRMYARDRCRAEPMRFTELRLKA